MQKRRHIRSGFKILGYVMNESTGFIKAFEFLLLILTGQIYNKYSKVKSLRVLGKVKIGETGGKE